MPKHGRDLPGLWKVPHDMTSVETCQGELGRVLWDCLANGCCKTGGIWSLVACAKDGTILAQAPCGYAQEDISSLIHRVTTGNADFHQVVMDDTGEAFSVSGKRGVELILVSGLKSSVFATGETHQAEREILAQLAAVASTKADQGKAWLGTRTGVKKGGNATETGLHCE